MPAWSAAGTTNLSSGERLEVLTATDAAITGALQGFTFSPQPVPIALTIFNNSAVTVTLQASPDNVTWWPVTSQGTAVTAPTDTAETFTVSSGLYYRLSTGAATTLGATIWVAR